MAHSLGLSSAIAEADLPKSQLLLKWKLTEPEQLLNYTLS